MIHLVSPRTFWRLAAFGLVGLALLAFADAALAGNFWTPRNLGGAEGWQYDDSYKFLLFVFGSVIHAIAETGSIPSCTVGVTGTIPDPSSGCTVLSFIAAEINSAILIIGIVIMTYTYLAGSIHTANDGEFLGKKWSSWAVPLRTGMAIAVLLPTTAGYSFLQVVLLWGALQGVGLANHVNYRVLQFFAFHKMMTPPAAPKLMMVDSMFPMYVCKRMVEDGSPLFSYGVETIETTNDTFFVARWLSSAVAGVRNLVTETTSVTTAGWPTGFDYRINGVTPKSYCGRIRFMNADDADEFTSNLAAAGGGALPTAAENPPPLTPIPGPNPHSFYVTTEESPFKITKNDLEAFLKNMNEFKRDCAMSLISATPMGSCGVNTQGFKEIFDLMKLAATGDTAAKESLQQPEQLNKIGEIAMAIERKFAERLYSELNSRFFATVGAEDMAQLKPGGQYVENIIKWVHARGWIYAGSFYMKMASLNNVVQTMVNHVSFISFQTPDWAAIPLEQNSTAKAIYTLYVTFYGGDDLKPFDDKLSKVENNNWLIGGAQEISNNVSQQLMKAIGIGSIGEDWTDPVMEVKHIGDNLLIAAQLVLFAFLGLQTASKGSPAGKLVGMFKAGDGQLTVAGMILAIVMSMIATTLFGLGAYLSIYIPMMPFIFWALGVMMWFVLVVQAVFAAPLWAIAHLHPEGHEIVGKGSPGYMFVLSLLVRPVLMIFALYAAMILVKPVVWFFNIAFMEAFKSAQASSFTGIITFITMCSIYVTVITKAMSTIFAFINTGPDQIMRWIGGHDSVGAEANREIHGVQERVASSAQVASGGMRNFASEMARRQSMQASKGSGPSAGAPQTAYSANSQVANLSHQQGSWTNSMTGGNILAKRKNEQKNSIPTSNA